MVELYQLHAFFTAPYTCEFITNGESFWTVITYPPGPVNTGGCYFVTPAPGIGDIGSCLRHQILGVPSWMKKHYFWQQCIIQWTI